MWPFVITTDCAPYSAGTVLVVDPTTNTTATIAIASTTGNALWCDIAYHAPTGRLYAAPAGASSVLIIDPSTNATDTTALSSIGEGMGKYSGIVIAPTTQKLCKYYSRVESELFGDRY